MNLQLIYLTCFTSEVFAEPRNQTYGHQQEQYGKANYLGYNVYNRPTNIRLGYFFSSSSSTNSSTTHRYHFCTQPFLIHL